MRVERNPAPKTTILSASKPAVFWRCDKTMEKFTKKAVIFSLTAILLFFFAFAPNPILSQRELEVNYPTIQGLTLETEATPLPEYVRYIFNFSIAIVGLIGFAALIVGGFRYLISAGAPEKRKSAKAQIKSALLGVLILLFSYLILITLDPQFIIFRPLEITPVPPVPLPGAPIDEAAAPDLLGRIKELAEAVKRTVSDMDETAQELTELTGNCSCSTTQPLCLCSNYRGSCSTDSVNPCYAAEQDQPCPDNEEIKAGQQSVFAKRDDMLYYKNRALAERQDLIENLEKILYPKIAWHINKITIEANVLNQLPPEAVADRGLQQEILRILQEDKAELETEKGYKEQLKGKLLELAEAIEEVRDPGQELSELPDECLTNVPSQCQGSCAGGCHDTLGCFPGTCGGGNPCPTSEIQSRADDISDSASTITQIADEIIGIVNSIR